MASIKFWVNFCPFFFNVAISSNLRKYISAILLIKFLFINCSIILSPRPSIFIHSLETKCIIFLTSFAGHSIPIHLLTASPSSRITGAPHTGQTFGISKTFSVPSLFFFFTSRISGITSPAF